MAGWNDNPEQPPRVRVLVIAAEGQPQPGTLTSDDHGDVIEMDDDDGDDERDEGGCNLCGGQVMLLGTLGRRTHGRCRDCGMDQSYSEVVPEAGPGGEDAHLEADYEDRVSGCYTDDPYGWEDDPV